MREDGRLILSIPYEKGWRITVNGEGTEPALFGEALMALDLEAGEYTVAMQYTPEGKYAGILVSVASLCVFLLLRLPHYRRRM